MHKPKTKLTYHLPGWLRIIMIIIGILLGLILLVIVYAFIYRTNTKPLLRTDNYPAGDYAEAKTKFTALLAQDGPEISNDCHSFVLDHGQKTTRTIVIFHGVTHCPYQVRVLAQQFYNAGYNVLAPRLPHHGESDRLHNTMYDFKASDEMVTTNAAIDIAAGLGDQVTLFGASGSGPSVALAAQLRPDVARAVVAVPLFAPKGVPVWLIQPLVGFIDLIPNLKIWWSPDLKDKPLDPKDHAYPFYYSKSMGEFMKIGIAYAQAKKQPAASQATIAVILNDNDQAIDNTVAKQLLSDASEIYVLDKSLGLNHDIINPDRADQRIDVVYPEIERLAGARK